MMSDQTSQNVQWNRYWEKQTTTSNLYGRVASFYRRYIISPSVKRNLEHFVSSGDLILHAGSGSGEIDVLLPEDWNIIPIDFCLEAVHQHRNRYASLNRQSAAIQADLFILPFIDEQFKVCFNLGVMEHFTDDEVIAALKEMRRVTSADGKIVMYWPPKWGPTVLVLHTLSHVLRILGKDKIQLFPPEINLFQSRRRCARLLARADLIPTRFSYGPGDLFTHVIVIAERA
jgi:ubiquinone/menaquinone biosynthesis C-methylase UbiE